jgi:hypothetical protein
MKDHSLKMAQIINYLKETQSKIDREKIKNNNTSK